MTPSRFERWVRSISVSITLVARSVRSSSVTRSRSERSGRSGSESGLVMTRSECSAAGTSTLPSPRVRAADEPAYNERHTRGVPSPVSSIHVGALGVLGGGGRAPALPGEGEPQASLERKDALAVLGGGGQAPPYTERAVGGRGRLYRERRRWRQVSVSSIHVGALGVLGSGGRAPALPGEEEPPAYLERKEGHTKRALRLRECAVTLREWHVERRSRFASTMTGRCVPSWVSCRGERGEGPRSRFARC